MADSSTQTNQKDQVVKSMITVQIVHFHCSNCGDEIEEVKLCKSCKAPMRVIQVTEKYGEEAEKYLEDLKRLPNVVYKTDAAVEDNSSNSSVENAFANEEELKRIDEIDSGYGPVKQKTEDDMLAEFVNINEDGIFSSDDEGVPSPKRKDLEDLLLELDNDEAGIDPNVDFGEEDLDSFKDL
jgi:predicted RNA-binding Zn-ribbon protein involved in translation (DUF1610 family)